ncbi:hypothetical protein FQZ97_779710 [compost metagenome]
MQAIDVAAGEGLGIEGIDAVQHLLLAEAAAGTEALGDRPEAVAPCNLVALAVIGGGRRPGLHRCHLAGCDRHLAGCAERGGAGGIGGSRWVQQQGVFAQQPTIGARHFDDEIQVGLTNRLVGNHADTAVRAADHRAETQVVEEYETVDAGLLEGIGGRQPDLDLAGIEITDLEQFDFGIQRLVEGGVQGDFAWPQRRYQTRIKRRAGCKRQKELVNPCHLSSPATRHHWSRP